MDEDLLLAMLEASSVWLCSKSTYIQLKAEYVQCHIRLCLVSGEIEDPRRAYTKKEMAYLRKKYNVLSNYEEILEKQIYALCPDITLAIIYNELRYIVNVKRMDKSNV